MPEASSVSQKIAQMKEQQIEHGQEVRQEADKEKQEKREGTAQLFADAGGLFSKGLARVRERATQALQNAEQKAKQAGEWTGEQAAKLRGGRSEIKKTVSGLKERVVVGGLNAWEKVTRLDDAAAESFRNWSTEKVNAVNERTTEWRASIRERIGGAHFNEKRARKMVEKAERVIKTAEDKVESYRNELPELVKLAGVKIKLEDDYDDIESSPVMQEARKEQHELLMKAVEHARAAREVRNEAKQMREQAAQKRQNGEVCSGLIDTVAGTLGAEGPVYQRLGLAA